MTFEHPSRDNRVPLTAADGSPPSSNRRRLRAALMFYAVGGAGVAALIAACSSTGDGGLGSGAGSGGQPIGGSAGSGNAPGTTGGQLNSGTAGAPVNGGSGGSGTAGIAGVAGASTAGSGPVSGGSGGGGGAPSAGTGGGGVAGSAGSANGGAGTAGSGTAGSGTAGSGTAGSGTGGASSCGPPEQLEKFSFFVTSHKALQALSGSVDGFGGDLRYGESDGLKGADKICTEIAERSMKCSGQKGWKAFLSTVKGGPDGGPIHAVDRIGDGPWYDRVGRIVAMNKTALINQRPMGADPAILNDLPNEDGVPNHAPDGELLDNHDMITGSDEQGRLYTRRTDPLESTCKDWTSKERWGAPRVGHPWPTMGKGGFTPPSGGGSGFPGAVPGGPGGTIGDLAHWISALDEAGCAPGAFLVEMGPPNPNNPTIGSGGGYGGFYCFASIP